MNNLSISLSSDTTNLFMITSPFLLHDVTTVTINFENIDESSMPLYVKIDWGDGMIDSYDNNIIQTNLNTINNFNFNPIFTNVYSHDYYPSEKCLYKSLSAQILIKYSNSDESWFILPFNIRTFDYFESIYNLKLVNCNILPNESNSKQYQFISERDNYLLELRSD